MKNGLCRMSNEELFFAGMYDELWENNRGITNKYISIYYSALMANGFELDDIWGEAGAAFAKTLNEYQKESARKYVFATIYGTVLNGVLCKMLRYAKAVKREAPQSLIYMDSLISGDDGKEMENNPSWMGYEFDYDLSMLISKSVEYEKDDCSTVLKMTIAGYTQQEIADHLNCTQVSVSRMLTRVKNNLKALMNGEEIELGRYQASRMAKIYGCKAEGCGCMDIIGKGYCRKHYYKYIDKPKRKARKDAKKEVMKNEIRTN